MRTWDRPPVQTKVNKAWVGLRSDGVMYYSMVSREHLETYLDERCECSVKKRMCDFHKVLKYGEKARV